MITMRSVDAIDHINIYRDMYLVESQHKIQLNFPKTYKDFFFDFSFKKRGGIEITLPFNLRDKMDGEIRKDSLGRFGYVNNDGLIINLEDLDRVQKLYAVIYYLNKLGNLKNGMTLDFNPLVYLSDKQEIVEFEVLVRELNIRFERD